MSGGTKGTINFIVVRDLRLPSWTLHVVRCLYSLNHANLRCTFHGGRACEVFHLEDFRQLGEIGIDSD